ncbi:hypothetical protein HPB52_025256 [Rhipicephalus sanguineus]|uniref:Uncharacterized protein n=1 Tax=Rhipicephalus sanguineus TaxID=34632 RepID=A0A9D4TD97_RHISA|nr:hypothetical protein HPB52_025256 [Rhipicephalus sanguineus]
MELHATEKEEILARHCAFDHFRLPDNARRLVKMCRTRRWLTGDASSRRLMPTAKNASVGLGYLKQHRGIDGDELCDMRQRVYDIHRSSARKRSAWPMHVRTMRVDTLLVSEAEKVAIEHRAEEQRQKLSSLSDTRRKQSLIGDCPEAAGCGTEFMLLSYHC